MTPTGEYVNFAYIQTDGVPFPAGSPSPLGPLVSTNGNTLTTGQTGFMVASAANGFAAVKWDPNGTNCDFAAHNLPQDFHPTYATSSEHTRVPGAAHSYNIVFSDESGHFEYCSSVAQEFGPCTSTTGRDKKPGADAEFQSCRLRDRHAAHRDQHDSALPAAPLEPCG